MTKSPSEDREDFISFGAWWVEARSYPTMQSAGEIYSRISTLVKSAEPLNVSVYRLTLNDLPLVAMVGEAPLARSWRRRFQRAYGPGMDYEIPDEVAVRLLRRSLIAWETTQGFVERRNIREVVE